MVLSNSCVLFVCFFLSSFHIKPSKPCPYMHWVWSYVLEMRKPGNISSIKDGVSQSNHQLPILLSTGCVWEFIYFIPGRTLVGIILCRSYPGNSSSWVHYLTAMLSKHSNSEHSSPFFDTHTHLSSYSTTMLSLLFLLSLNTHDTNICYYDHCFIWIK